MTNQCETENNIIHAEPHDVRMARKILAIPRRDPRAEQSMQELLAGAVVRYWEKLQGGPPQGDSSPTTPL